MKKIFIMCVIGYLLMKLPSVTAYLGGVFFLILPIIILLFIMRSLFRSVESESARIRRILRKYDK